MRKRRRPVFLSASVPDPLRNPRYFESADPARIRQAVGALVRVAAPSARLVFGGHPAISPLVLDAATQVKLLRALGEQTIQRVGSNQNIKVDVRVVAATNKNLEAMVREGKFRDDLFYRLDVVPIHLPPLRERREDIPLLIQAFVQEFARQNSKRITGLSAEAQDALQCYEWPGNIRELRAAIEHAVNGYHFRVVRHDGVARILDRLRHRIQ